MLKAATPIFVCFLLNLAQNPAKKKKESIFLFSSSFCSPLLALLHIVRSYSSFKSHCKTPQSSLLLPPYSQIIYSFPTFPVLCVQSCPTLCNTTDYSLPGSSVHGILQASILEWAALCSSRRPSQPRDQPTSPLSPELAGCSLLHHLGRPMCQRLCFLHSMYPGL